MLVSAPRTFLHYREETNLNLLTGGRTWWGRFIWPCQTLETVCSQWYVVATISPLHSLETPIVMKVLLLDVDNDIQWEQVVLGSRHATSGGLKLAYVLSIYLGNINIPSIYF